MNESSISSSTTSTTPAAENLFVRLRRFIVTRIFLVAFTILPTKHNIRFKELIEYFTAKPGWKNWIEDMKKASTVEETDEYYIYNQEELLTPIYYPKSLPLDLMYVIAAEQFNDNSFHRFQTPEVPALDIKPSDIVVDAGCAEGIFPAIYYKSCKKIYAFEPLPDFVKSLHLTFAGVDNVEIVPKALGSKKAKSYIDGTGAGAFLTEKNTGTSIDISTIDSEFYEKGIQVDFIKADVEGFEIELLEGAKKTIQEHSPKIAFTTYHFPGDDAKFRTFLKNCNPKYKFYSKGVTESGGTVMLYAWV